MASGLPIVATDAGGIPEFLDHEISALLVPPRDPEALADALTRLIGDPDLSEAMGRSNRKRVETTYDWDRIVDRVEALYKRVTAG